MLLVLGAASFLQFAFLRKDPAMNVSSKAADSAAPAQKVSYATIIKGATFWFLLLICGFYFVGEHGAMNWLNIYCQEHLGMTAAQAAVYPSLFFGGMTAGRLLLSGLVNKLGILKSLMLSLASGALLYTAGFVLGGSALYLMLGAGFLLPIVYPTMTLCVQLYFPQSYAAAALDHHECGHGV